MASQLSLPRETPAHAPQLMLGDCLERLAEVPDGSVDMVFADLPYGVTANKWDCQIPLAFLWAQLKRTGKATAAFVFAATQPFATTLVNSWPKGFRYDLVWVKPMATDFLNANCRPLRAHESILVFSRATANPQSSLRMTYIPQKTSGKPYTTPQSTTSTSNYNHGRGTTTPAVDNLGDRFPRSVFAIAHDGDKVHPTQKPVALLDWLIRTYSNEGETVLDPTMGSGTTGVSCAQNGRRFIGIERDPGYFAAAQKRIAEAAQ